MPAQKNQTPGYNLQQAQRDIAQLRGNQARTGVVLPSGYSGFRVITMPADYTTFTVTASSVQQCTKAWSIPANDAQAGTQYRLTLAGNAVQGSTQQALFFETYTGAFAQCAFGATLVAINAPFNWRLVLEATVISTGSSGTAHFMLNGIAAGGDIPGQAIVGLGVAQAFNTTAPFSLAVGCYWNSTTGAPTTTTRVSMLERLGP
jgi:hypothetical protein